MTQSDYGLDVTQCFYPLRSAMYVCESLKMLIFLCIYRCQESNCWSNSRGIILCCLERSATEHLAYNGSTMSICEE